MNHKYIALCFYYGIIAQRQLILHNENGEFAQ